MGLLGTYHSGRGGSYGNNSSDISGALSSFINQFNLSNAKAKFANQKRYKQMLNLVDQQSGQEISDIHSQFANQASNTLQGLARNGMAGTTVGPSLLAGIKRHEMGAVNTAKDAARQAKLGIMNSRTDSYPDMNGLLSLLAGLSSKSGDMSGLAAALAGLKF